MAPEPRPWLVARSPSPEVTEAAGEALGRVLEAGALLGLVGELGAGKTCFVRGLARGLGIRAGVTSPTFTRMVVHQGRLALYHFDAWREGSRELLHDAGEVLCGDGVAVIEWADRVATELPRPRLEIRLAHQGPEVRGLDLRWVAADVPGPDPREPAARAAAQAVRDTPGLEILDPA